jgi:hypothetical protein
LLAFCWKYADFPHRRRRRDFTEEAGVGSCFVAGGKGGNMKKLVAVLAVGVWLGMGTASITAQQLVPSHPAIVPGGSGAKANVFPAGLEPMQKAVPATTGSLANSCNKCQDCTSCVSHGGGCTSGHCGASCFDRLCCWLCYKPLPVPCDCLYKCCGNCSGCCPPPVYAFFLRPGCSSGCQQGCCGAHH